MENDFKSKLYVPISTNFESFLNQVSWLVKVSDCHPIGWKGGSSRNMITKLHRTLSIWLVRQYILEEHWKWILKTSIKPLLARILNTSIQINFIAASDAVFYSNMMWNNLYNLIWNLFHSSEKFCGYCCIITLSNFRITWKIVTLST